MAFRPTINSNIQIDNVAYRFTEHPTAKGIPYGQTGRRATVYQVQDIFGRYHALKVFFQRFRIRSIEQSASRLQAFAGLPGLQVCSRKVLTQERHPQLIEHSVDLEFAVLMPWVEGKTWFEFTFTRQAISRDQSLALARGFATLLATMEQNGLAHCDLSGPNVIVPPFSPGSIPLVTLVDVEEMFGPGLERPATPPSGTEGYAHRTATGGLWSPDADRFAGAILLSEMLAWCDPRIQQAAAKEQFFLNAELQGNSSKHSLMYSVLVELWGAGVANLFQQAWHSQILGACPMFSDWLSTLNAIGQPVFITPPAPVVLPDTHFPGKPVVEETGPVSAPQSPVIGFRGGLLTPEANKGSDGRIWQPQTPAPGLPRPPVPVTQPYAGSSQPPHPPIHSNVGAEIGPSQNTRTVNKPKPLWWVWVVLSVGACGLLFVGAWVGFSLMGDVSNNPPAAPGGGSQNVPVITKPTSTPTSAIIAALSSKTPTKRVTSSGKTATPASNSTKIILITTVDNTYLRAGPDQWHPTLSAAFPKGTKLEALERFSSWYYVRAPDGLKGWVYKDWVNDESVNVKSLPEARSVPTQPPSPVPTKPKKKYP